MISDQQKQEILERQPLQRMQYFAALLGWRGLQLESVRLPEVSAKDNIPDGIVIYYATTDRKFFLQINTWPHGQTRKYSATVRADRYGIPNIGWHPFELFEDGRIESETQRLMAILHRKLFKDGLWRRQLALRSPELGIRFAKRSKWPVRFSVARR
jgi:hypothetical protein